MNDDTVGSGPTPEHLEIDGGKPFRETRPRGPGSRRTAIAAVTGLSVVAAAGAAVWAWQAWVAQGPQPSEALPGNTLAYVAIDLDPPGGQKIEALGVLKSFPSLKKNLGLDTDDDVRRSVFEEFASESSCTLDYGKDVEPWIGDRAAFAVVDHAHPEPVVVLQVEKADDAVSGLDAVMSRCEAADFGFALDGGWAVLARNEKIARTVVEDAGEGTLAENQDFQEQTGAAGDPGVITLYAAPEAGPAMLELIEEEPFSYLTFLSVMNSLDPLGMLAGSFLTMGIMAPTYDEGFAEDVGPEERPVREPTRAEEKLMAEFEHFEELSKAEQDALVERQEKLMEKLYADDMAPRDEELDEELDEEFRYPELPADQRQALEDFSGLGGVVRFEDGAVEVEMVSDQLVGTFGDLYDGDAGDDAVSGLPDSTAVAFGAGLGAGWAEKLVARMTGQYGLFGQSEEEAVAGFERATGLDLPGDLEDLGGDSVTFAAGEGFDPSSFDTNLEGQPVAAWIKGDPDTIEAALDKIRATVSTAEARLLLSRRVGEDVVVGASAAYLDQIAGGGDLGDTGRFREVVPNADEATSVFFVNFDSGDWLVEQAGDEAADARPLEALGFTTTVDGDRQRTLVRLSVED